MRPLLGFHSESQCESSDQTSMSAGNLELQAHDKFMHAIAKSVTDLVAHRLSARAIDRNLESEEIQ